MGYAESRAHSDCPGRRPGEAGAAGAGPGSSGAGTERARIVLLSAEGLTGPQIAQRAGCTEPTVIKWRRQYAEDGLAGLEDAPRPGGPKSVLTEEAISMILCRRR